MRTESRSRLTTALCGGLCALLAACSGGGSDRAARRSGVVAPPPRVQPAPQRLYRASLPAREELARDLVMVPISWDARGCVQYRMESAARPALRSIFYRTRAGDFSTIKEEAACT